MRLAHSCQPFIERVEKTVTRIVDEAVSADKSRTYINAVSEIKSFIESLKVFLSTLKLLEELFPDLKVGRPCFRWVYAEEPSTISLARLESGLSIVYTSDYIRITYGDKSITLYELPHIGIKVNQYSDEIALEDEENIVTKRSLIIDAISVIRNQLEKSTENLNLCIKYTKLRTS